MFGWRRRSEGFEWNEYVRTTVLVRRRNRERKLDEARLAALAKVQKARDKGVEAGRASVNYASDKAAEATVGVWRAFVGLMAAALGIVTSAASSAWRAIASKIVVRASAERPQAPRDDDRQRPPAPAAAVPAPPPPMTPSEALSTLIYAIRVALRTLFDIARLFPLRVNHAIGAALALGVVYFGGEMLRGEQPLTTGSLAPPSVLAPVEISGRATAVTGDSLRLDGRVIRLSEIEAPIAGQPCFKANGRRWSCSESARSALDRLMRGKRIICKPMGSDGAGRMIATCAAGERDLGLELVRNGNAFAADGASPAYADAEQQASAAKAGLWQGNTMRPAAWRERAWEDAKRAAPDGCPIKGLARAASRTYALPWSQGYDAARLRPDRGDRWFCSEDEAQAAGFLPSDRT